MSDISAAAPSLQGRTRAPKAKVGYAFIPVPEKRARGWYQLKRTHGRALSTELWLLGRGQPIEVCGDWRIDLCRQLEIPGRERTNWCQAMDEAHAAGLLTYQGGRVTVHYETATNPHPVETLQAPNKHPIDTLRVPSFDLSVENRSTHVSQIRSEEIRSEESETRERAHTREAPPSRRPERERIPVGEAPPELPPREARIPAETRCWKLYQRALGTEHLMLSPNHHEALRALVSAAKAEADGSWEGEAFDRAVQRILAAWMAEKYFKEHKPSLANLKIRLEAGMYARRKQTNIPAQPREETMWEKQARWARENAAAEAAE